jgi:spermidine synthase
LGGLAAGGALALAAQSWLALYGRGLSSSLVCLLSVCVGVCLAIPVSRVCSPSVYPTWARWLSLTAWMGLLPFWLSLADLGPACFSTDMLESVPLQMLAMMPAAIALAGLPVFLITLTVWNRSSGTAAPILWSLWTGGALCTFALMPFFDSQILFWSLVALSLGAAGWYAWGSDDGRTNPLSDFRFAAANTRHRRRSTGPGTASGIWLFPLLSGFLLAVVSMVVRQWCPVSVPVLLGQACLGTLGILTARQLSGGHRIGRMMRRIPVTCWLLVPILVAQTMILFEPSVTRFMLTLSTQWSSPFTLLTARIAVVSLFPFVLGVSAGIWSRHAGRSLNSNNSSRWIGVVCLVGLSWGTGACLLSAGFRVGSLVVAASVTALIGGGLSFTPDRGRSRATGTWGYRISRLTVTALMACLVLGAANLPPGTGQLPARVLFSPVAAGQFRAGLDWRLVPHVDDARLMDEIPTEHGLLTTYNYHGLETALRCDGIPAGYLSHDYRLMPQFPSDALMVVLPSVVHGEVRNIAVCHWNCGVTVSSALEFPVERIDCFDAAGPTVKATYGRHLDNPWAGLNPLTDTRVRLRSVSPGMAMRSRGHAYDLIISDPPRSMLAAAAEEMTTEFYRNAAERLRPGGLFCQRFLHYDHGPRAWSDVLATLRSVYPHVLAIEMIPGETLFVASASRDISVVPELADRLQKPQVRRVLARFGWDWGHVLRLPTVQSSKCDELLGTLPGEVQSVISPDLCQTHAPDALRWSNKWNEKTSAFASFRSRLADLAGEDANSGQTQRRMEEVVAQQNTMSEQVDLPWVYRSKLKEFLSLKPRSEIVQVKGEKPRQELHPVDKRRVEYLEALSEAHNSRPLSAETIDRMAAFDTPFDPLISYFLHYEAAELYARLPEADPQAEFQHRLKTIYFGDVRDKSVRNVVAALELLLEHEDLVGSPQARFDHIHGLVQFLLNRWQLRKGYSPRNTDEALVDIQDSLSVAERAVATMDRLVDRTDFGRENWTARREYLELCLMTPLRSYRSRLLPRYERAVHKRQPQE